MIDVDIFNLSTYYFPIQTAVETLYPNKSGKSQNSIARKILVQAIEPFVKAEVEAAIDEVCGNSWKHPTFTIKGEMGICDTYLSRIVFDFGDEYSRTANHIHEAIKDNMAIRQWRWGFQRVSNDMKDWDLATACVVKADRDRINEKLRAVVREWQNKAAKVIEGRND